MSGLMLRIEFSDVISARPYPLCCPEGDPARCRCMGTPLLHRPQGLVCLQFSQVYELSAVTMSCKRTDRHN
jgi:hypothetical protein